MKTIRNRVTRPWTTQHILEQLDTGETTNKRNNWKQIETIETQLVQL